jgi:hypothetical protein
MKKLFSPAAILLYVLSFLVLFFVGATIAGISGVGKGQGLAAGAIVFGYALMFSMVGVAGAVLTAWRTERQIIVKVNWVLTVLLLAILVVVFIRFQTMKTENEESGFEKPKTHVAPGSLSFSATK